MGEKKQTDSKKLENFNINIINNKKITGRKKHLSSVKLISRIYELIAPKNQIEHDIANNKIR